MMTKDHPLAIQAFLQASDRAFDAGDNTIGSLKLWEAAECALSMAAAKLGRPCQTEDDHFDLLELLMAESGTREDRNDGYDLVSGYLVAGYFQNNADYDFMEGYELEGSRHSARRFIDELVSFAG